jgi:reductive dehalogenase
MHGAAHVSFVELDTDTTEKLIYAYDTGFGPAQGPRLDILDVDEPEDNTEEGYRVIPKKARWVIVYTMRMADELMKRPITQIGDRAHMYMYNLKSLLQGQLQNFLRTLGYMCLGEASLFNATALSVGLGVLSGLGEQSRQGQMITPEHGLMQRIQKVITDLPLPPGKPVDFGVVRFCRTCKKCAEYCPPQAISKETEPSWSTRDKPYHSPGVRNWHWPQEKCLAYIHQVGGCALCFSVCPYSKKHNTPYNDLWKASVATNPLLNRFWRQMDDSLYGSGVRDTEKFWELELPPWGYE